MSWKENNDPKYVKVKHILEPDVDEPTATATAADVLAAAEFEYDHDNPHAVPPTPVGPTGAPRTPTSFIVDPGVDEPKPPGLNDSRDEDAVADIFMDDPEDTAERMVDYLVMSGADPTDA